MAFPLETFWAMALTILSTVGKQCMTEEGNKLFRRIRTQNCRREGFCLHCRKETRRFGEFGNLGMKVDLAGKKKSGIIEDLEWKR